MYRLSKMSLFKPFEVMMSLMAIRAPAKGFWIVFLYPSRDGTATVKVYCSP
jgi:hypothetical protein